LNLEEQIEKIKKEFYSELERVEDISDLEEVRIEYLSRKGKIRTLFSELKNLSEEERKEAGNRLNTLKEEIGQSLESIRSTLSKKPEEINKFELFDFSIPGQNFEIGYIHPLNIINEELYSIFRNLNFKVIDGFEIEDDYHNFEALNIPKWHPARKMQDSFYIDEERLLRTHTSPVQIRAMENLTPPFRIVTIGGRCYRRDAIDATHSPVFHQIEGLVVDENVSLSDLSWTLTEMMRGIFGKGINVRFIPSYFPFVEPGAETLISCPFCTGDGCSICGNSGWIELGGSGMVHPQVFRNVGIDPAKFKGFAFGWGIERLAMIKFGIGDIRLFFENSVDFLRQF
jgi:phenylalanyl-tRNA synthetase alpha chain